MKWRNSFPVLFFSLGFFCHYLFFSTSHDDKTYLDQTETLNVKLPKKNLVIFVLSSIRNFERRQVIRETWANGLDSSLVEFMFVINGGDAIAEDSNLIYQESSQHQDLLIFHGIKDSFSSLTHTVLNAMIWATGGDINEAKVTTAPNFSSFSFFLKCDDDSYVRVGNVLNELQTTHQGNDMLYWGFFDGRAKVKKTGKYKELGWNICDNYLPYAQGGGYVIAYKPVEFIAKNAEFLRRYQNEDTSVGAWLANLKGLQRLHDPRFDTEYLSRGCHQSYLVTHKHSMDAMRKMHSHLLATGNLCPKEYRTRLSYKYDWNSIPSKCCARNNPVIP